MSILKDCCIDAEEDIRTEIAQALSDIGFTDDDAVSVKAHEGCHTTGAEHRLKRKLSTKDVTAYAYEELIAELGSAMVCASLGIPLEKLRHTDYIGVWLKRLKDDTSYIFRAAADANRAMQYLMKEAA